MNRETAAKVAIHMDAIRVAEDAASKARHALDQLAAGAVAWRHRDLIKAYAEGAEIQIKHGGVWRDVVGPVFAFMEDYRIKPEQISVFMNVYSGMSTNNFGAAWETKARAEENVSSWLKGEGKWLGAFEFKQVLPE